MIIVRFKFFQTAATIESQTCRLSFKINLKQYTITIKKHASKTSET